ncbi:MAG: iron-sulfur cluster assembly scaffold protein [Thermoplasmataceae archaeon]
MTDVEEKTEILMDHYRSPHNYGRMESPTAELLEYNPVCGDAVQMFVKLKGNTVEDVKFIGRGCSISQGSASMVTDMARGKSVEEIMRIKPQYLLDLIGLPLGPSREKCALLPLNTLQKCLSRLDRGNVKI